MLCSGLANGGDCRECRTRRPGWWPPMRRTQFGAVMNLSALHHISLVTSDLERSARFYREVLGLHEIARPPFKLAGKWLVSGPVQVHLIANAAGTFRANPTVDLDDTHFALRVDDFEQAITHLTSSGYRQDAAEDDPMRLVVRRAGVAGYPQAYLRDPDGNIVEINAGM